MNVCDLCIYNPPSSCDGKPCTMCPATTNMELEQEPSGDLISREDTLTAFADYVGSGMSMDDYDALWNIVTKMPSVKQEPKTGHWKRHCIPTKSELWWECSECKHALAQIEKTKYCPNCGAKMVEQKVRIRNERMCSR